MDLNEFRDGVLRRFTTHIADVFFCYIENDRELMHEYLSILGTEKGTDETNQFLELALKKYFGLNEQGESHEPKSKLITSYTQYINPSEEGAPPNK